MSQFFLTKGALVYVRAAVLSLLASLLLALAAGCGDSDDSSGDSSLSQAEFVERAEEICKTETEEALARMGPYVQRLEREGNGAGGPRELQAEAIQAIILPSVESQIDQIRKLGVPSGDEEQVKAFLTALEDAVDTSEAAPLTPRANAAFSRVNRIGRAYGLRRCAYG
jgi:hypothetical protein